MGSTTRETRSPSAWDAEGERDGRGRSQGRPPSAPGSASRTRCSTRSRTSSGRSFGSTARRQDGIFEDRRDGSFDVTLTRLGEADKDIRSCFRTTVRYGGREFEVYRSGLDTVGRLEILKRRIRELVTAVRDR